MLPPEEVAAIFVEPIQGEGGYSCRPDSSSAGTAAHRDRHGILLVVDEVQSGMGRTGKMVGGGAHRRRARHGVQSPRESPAACLSASLMAQAEIMDWVPGSHASTFGGNPVCDRGGTGHDRRAGARRHATNAEPVGNHHGAHWPLACELPLVGDVRGQGLMIGIELVTDKKAKTPGGAKNATRLFRLAFEKGVLLLGAGPNSIRLAPPLIVSREQADLALDVLEECIREVGKGRHPKVSIGEPTGS